MKKLFAGLFMGLAMLGGASAMADSAISASSEDAIVVIALVKVKPGTEAAFRAAAVKILAPTRQEAGSISYDFHQSTDDTTEFATVEHWRSEADLDQHMSLPHMQQFFSEVGPYFAPGYPQIKKFNKFEN